MTLQSTVNASARRRAASWLLLLCMVSPVPSALAQGVVRFSNVVLGGRYLIYGVEPGIHSWSIVGNSITGSPPGFAVYHGLPLEGPGYTAELLGGPAAAPDHQLVPLARTGFRTGSQAGVVVPVGRVVVPDVPGGEYAKFRLRAWDNRGGTASDWDQAICRSWFGQGPTFTSLLGTTNEPGLLTGLISFNLFAMLTPSFYYTVYVNSGPSFTYIDNKDFGRDVAVIAGETVSITVGSSFGGFCPWQRDGTNLPGATSCPLIFSPVHVEDAGSYGVEDGDPDNCYGSFAMNLIVVEPGLRDPVRTGDGSFVMRLEAAPYRTFMIETSSNLAEWAPWRTQQLSSASAWITNAPPLPTGPQFYRALLITN